MSKKTARFATYGIEDDTVVAPAVEPEQEVEIDETVPDEQVEAETELAERDVNEVESDVAEMTDVAESLEAICEGIQATFKNGGLNRQGAAFALQSADLQLARLGVEGIAISVEDFESAEVVGAVAPVIAPISNGEAGAPIGTAMKTSVEPDAASVVKSEEAGVAGTDNTDSVVEKNIAISQEAIAGLRDMVKKIWAAVTAAWAKFMEAVKGFFNKIFDFTKRQGRRAADLAVRLGKLPGSEVKAAKIKFNLKNIVTPEDLKKLIEIQRLCGTSAEETLKGIESALDGAYKDVLSKDEATQAKGLEAIQALIELHAGSKVSKTETVGEDKVEITEDGGVTVVSQEADGEAEVDSANLPVLVETCKEIEAAAEASGVLAKAKAKCEAILARIKSKGDAFVNKCGEMGDAASDAVKKAVSAVAGFVGGLPKKVMGSFRNTASFVGKKLKAGNEYVTAQYKNFKGSEAVAAEPQAAAA